MYSKSGLGVFLLFLISAAGHGGDHRFRREAVNKENKVAKPLFPNLFLPPLGENKFVGDQPSALAHNHPPESPCPDPSSHSVNPVQPYPPQFPPFYQTETSPPPPIPELFRKSVPTPQPSIFQDPKSFQTKSSSTPPIPELFRKSTTTTQSSIFQKAPPTESATQKSVTPTPILQRIKDAESGSPTSTPPPAPKRPNELFPGTRKPSREKFGRKLNFKPPPEPIQNPVYPNYAQPAQENYDDELDQQPQDRQQSYLTPPSIKYKIAVVADLGKDARVGDGTFKSFLKEGSILVQKNKNDPTKYNVTIDLNEKTEAFILGSKFNNDGEGFELSTLNTFNGKLYSCDDETGIIYELKQLPVEKRSSTPVAPDRLGQNGSRRARAKPRRNTTYVAHPWIILSNEEENSAFRCEWATVKDEHLWVGSTGILVRKAGEENVLDKTRQGVKKVSPTGMVEHLDWTKNYQKISESIGLPENKGFAVHEGVAWSDHLQQWLFTPRRISQERYDQRVYHKRGGNTAIFVDDSFEQFKMEHLGDLVETAGFTSIKFIPGTDDQLILALKAGFDTQTNELMSTLEVFDINGDEVTPEVSIGKGIYAGVEFI